MSTGFSVRRVARPTKVIETRKATKEDTFVCGLCHKVAIVNFKEKNGQIFVELTCPGCKEKKRALLDGNLNPFILKP